MATVNRHVTNMTEGSPLGHIVRFMLPLLVGNLFQQLYNVVDSVVVGNYVGANALAAVGTCGSTSFLFFALSSGLAIGIGILASQYFGARDYERFRATIANSIWILVVIGTVVSSVGFFAARPFMRLLNVPEVILPDAVTYLRVTSLGIVSVALYNGVAALLRALGDSRSPLYFLIVSCAVNIVLDLLFVLYMGWGVFGVALATVISQFFSFVVSVVYAWMRVSYFRLKPEELHPDFDIIRRCLTLGIPMSMQSSLIAISVMVLQGVVNGFGETATAAYTVVNRVDQLVQQPFMSLGTALTSYAGQNIGAGKPERVKQGFRSATYMNLAFSLLMIPVFYIFGDNIVRSFVKDADVIEIGFRALRIDCLFFFVLGMIYVPRSILNGCGDSSFSLINGITEVLCRITFANVLIRLPFLGFQGLWFTNGLTWLVTSLVCVHRYLQGNWKDKAKI